MNNDAIIFSDAEDDVSWCDSCDARLYERKDQSLVCSNPECGKIYAAGSVTKHRLTLSPDKEPRSQGGPAVVPITGFTDKKKQKKSSVFDREDEEMMKIHKAILDQIDTIASVKLQEVNKSRGKKCKK
jgi:hypothetical protein